MSVITDQLINGIEIKGSLFQGSEEILSTDAVLFITKLHLHFNSRRKSILKQRIQRQAEIDSGRLPKFLDNTEFIRKGNWTVCPLPYDLIDRRVEIIGPVDRCTMVSALNSGANVYVADLEDSSSPSWYNVISGQINLKDAVSGKISYLNPENSQYCRLKRNAAAIMVRPRGWHMEEKNFLIDGQPISASLFDFGLFFYHNARKLIEKGSGPYFYLPKLENHLEARLWNDIFIYSQEELNIPVGTIKATVLIENILSVFEMDEILFELREHSAGLNCGHWDYIFSFIKKFRNNINFVFPERSQLTIANHFINSYSLLLIKTCHNRNAHAIGGITSRIPVLENFKANQELLETVRNEKEREVLNGHDGTVVMHPDLVPFVKNIFDKYIPEPNQIYNKMEDMKITSEDLLTMPGGTITMDGLRSNINVVIQYIEAWLKGKGRISINSFCEDTASAEISRSQIWQWLHNPNGILENGTRITPELYKQLLNEELEKVKHHLGEMNFHKSRFNLAVELFDKMVLEKPFTEFMTLVTYDYI